jgi:hypothetical protein
MPAVLARTSRSTSAGFSLWFSLILSRTAEGSKAPVCLMICLDVLYFRSFVPFLHRFSIDSETPAQRQQVISACAFIHHKVDGVEKVFLPKRAATKRFLPGVFELPGGHIDYGEDMVTDLKREITEEFNMTARSWRPLLCLYVYK